MSARLPLHLTRLESEAITIMHEVVAEFRAPVLLYSIGKDSNVLLHIARKAFYPGRLPFSVLHIDTTWKFRDMIAFRDRMAKKLGLQLIVHINEEGLALGINPFTSGSALYTQVMKTEGPQAGVGSSWLRCRNRRRKAGRGKESGKRTHLLHPWAELFLGASTAAARTLVSVQHETAS